MLREFFRWIAPVIVLVTVSWADEPHWAYRPLAHDAGEGIDELVENRLEERGLAFSERAAPDRLLRRVHLLLVGLPPSPEELARFRADPSPKKYQEVVEQLLARPGFGERWGRHWLDLARYADTSGLHQDSDRPHAWRYRDYVIRSFNADKPYRQFIREQLAGDLLDSNEADSLIATGFLRNGPSNEANVGSKELESYRYEQWDGILSATASVFLGQTISCARCHDHKSEPVTARDYYAMLSAFTNTSNAFVALEDGRAGKVTLSPILVRKTPPVPKGDHIRALVELPSERKPIHVLHRGDVDSPGEVVEPDVPAVLREMSAKFSLEDSPARLALAHWIADPENALTWRVMANRIWQHLFGKGVVATPNNFGLSGAEPSNRLLLDYLARSLRDHGGQIKPLIREICSSRTFQQSSDYHEQGHEADSANTFLWRYPRHRLEAEAIRDSILTVSGNLNRERGGPGIKPRVPAEILDQSMRNRWPNVKKEGPQHWKRSVYIYQKRQLLMPMMELLDVPSSSESCALRFESTTPTQALALLNDAFVNEQAQAAAQRAARDHPADPVGYLVTWAWGREPADGERAEIDVFLSKPGIGLSDLAVVLFNSSAFLYVD